MVILKNMFGEKKTKIKDSERSLISETVSIEGTINSSGAILRGRRFSVRSSQGISKILKSPV